MSGNQGIQSSLGSKTVRKKGNSDFCCEILQEVYTLRAKCKKKINVHMKKKHFEKHNFKYFNILVTFSSLLPVPIPQCEDYLIATHVLLLRGQAEPKKQLEKEMQKIRTAKQQEILEACSFFFTALRCIDLHTCLFCLIPKSSLPPC